MLAPYLEKLAIRQKLFTMHLLVTGSAMLLVFVAVVTSQYIFVKNDLLNDLDAQLSVIENNIGATIAFDDKATANQMLQSLRLNPSVDHAYIELENHTIFAEYQVEKNGNLLPNKVQKPVMQKGIVHLNRYIIVNNQRVGTIYLDANLSKVQERVKIFAIALLFAVLFAMLLVKFIAKKLNKYITDPIVYLESLVTNITNNNDYADRSTIKSSDEIGALSKGINNMLDDIKFRDYKLIEELEQRIVVEQKLDQLAYYDSQTTLPNRHAFTEHINKLMGVGEGSTEHFYLLMLDLDNFKVVNDTHGHAEGDQLLKQCGQRLRWILNEEDTVFRIGGDEFAIVLRGVKSIHDVEKICLRITHAISQQFMIGVHELFIGVSIGIVQYQNKNFTESTLVKNADMAMYWAKSAGKNTYKFYSEEIEAANHHHQKLTNDLQSAVKNNELELYYQPIINVESARTVGFEALLRWNHPEEGIISPNVFIPIAEYTGVIIPIGEWVINAALAQLKNWQVQHDSDLFVNINVSARQFFDKRIVDIINFALKALKITPKTVNFEITESILMEDVNKAIDILKALRKMGTGIAVDDFGTGHSSMNYLKMFPVDTLKIDKSFVRGVPMDSVDAAIVEAIFALARSLKLDVVAEGVETEQQFDFLRAKNCSKVQGYLFSEAIQADKVDKLLYQSNAIAKRFGNA
jgi:diguanylate cyclase